MLSINKGQRRRKREKTGFYLKVKIKQEKREETNQRKPRIQQQKRGKKKNSSDENEQRKLNKATEM